MGVASQNRTFKPMVKLTTDIRGLDDCEVQPSRSSCSRFDDRRIWIFALRRPRPADDSPAAAAASPAAAAQVDSARLVGADKEPGNWMTYGRTYSEQRFSPLNKINADNVKNLGLAWYYDLDTARGQEATPLVVDGVMYISTAWSMVKAFDAKTGKLLWDFDPKVGARNPHPRLLRCGQSRRRGVEGQGLCGHYRWPPDRARCRYRQAGVERVTPSIEASPTPSPRRLASSTTKS